MRVPAEKWSLWGIAFLLIVLPGFGCGGDNDQTSSGKSDAAGVAATTELERAAASAASEVAEPEPSSVTPNVQAPPERTKPKAPSFPARIRVPELKPAESRRPAPKVAMTDLNGRQITMDDFKGEVVLIAFWATWCPPCKKEIPHLIHLQEVYGDHGFTVLAPSLDEKGLAAIKPFLHSRPEINYTIIPNGHRLGAAYGGVNRIPTSFLIDKQGRIIERIQGLRSGDELEGFVMAALRES